MSGLRPDKKDELKGRLTDQIMSNIGDYHQLIREIIRSDIEAWDDETLLAWIDPKYKEEYTTHVNF